ncbi:hypothetical protein KBD11_01135 [Candidatus Saccharibacteria bacterium]|nr:hypothetical protein [Candidatus Saccharibacteria bacterium]
MNNRQYLVEDIDQIHRYFPGAEPIALHTPFDLTPPGRQIITDIFRAESPNGHRWKGGLRWTI